MEELLERIGGPWVVAAAVLVATNGGRKLLRSATKEAIRVGLTASDRVKEIVAEVREEAGDLVAEVKAERKEQRPEKPMVKAGHKHPEAD